MNTASRRPFILIGLAPAVLLGSALLVGAGAATARPRTALVGASAAAAGAGDGFTDEFFLEDRRFSATGTNPFFVLRPGHQLHLTGLDDGELVDLHITVLNKTKTITVPIDGKPRKIKARVVQEFETVDGELHEISLNYYAIDAKTNSVYYFGEDVCFYEDDECVSTEGSWLAGVNGAVPGIIMPGTFLLGSRYYQEQAPGIAEDRAENIEMGATYNVPAGVMQRCVVIHETSAIDPGAESEKVYAPGVGLIKDGPLELVEIRHDADDPTDD